MPIGLTVLPEAQSALLLRAYAQSRRAKQMHMLVGASALVVVIALSIVQAEVRPATLIANIGRLTNYIARTFALESGQSVWTDPREWFWGFWKWFRLIGETLIMAYLGTLLGSLSALVICFFAASNVAPSSWSRFVSRRILEFCRTVPELVFALLFVAAFGLGPLAGVLALVIHTLGALGKQFAEAVENADLKPFEGVIASGGNWVEAVRFAVLPQVLSNFTSYALLRFEINVRESAILGIVGAGGIGQELLVAVRRFYYSDVSAIVLMIIATVAVIDIATGVVRQRLITGGNPQ